jgi:hypothetical protein
MYLNHILTFVSQGLANFSEGRSLLEIVIETLPGGNAVNDPAKQGIFKFHDILQALTKVGPGTKEERSSVAAPTSYFLESFVYTDYNYRGITGVSQSLLVTSYSASSCH